MRGKDLPISGSVTNAIISGYNFSTDSGVLTIDVMLKYRSAGQGFGGYALYLPPNYKNGGDCCGRFIWRLMQVAEVGDLKHIVGRAIRVKHTSNEVKAIGHIVNDDWFIPDVELKADSSTWEQEETSHEMGERAGKRKKLAEGT